MNINVTDLAQLVKFRASSFSSNLMSVASTIDEHVAKVMSVDERGFSSAIVTAKHVIPTNILNLFNREDIPFPDGLGLKRADNNGIVDTVSGDDLTEEVVTTINSSRILSESLKTIATDMRSNAGKYDANQLINHITTAIENANINDELTEGIMRSKQFIIDACRSSASHEQLANTLINSIVGEQSTLNDASEGLTTTFATYTGVTPMGLITDALDVDMNWNTVWNGIKTIFNTFISIVRGVFSLVVNAALKGAFSVADWITLNIIDPVDLIYLSDGEDPSIREANIKIMLPSGSQILDDCGQNLVAAINTALADSGCQYLKINTPFGYFLLKENDTTIQFVPYVFDNSLYTKAKYEFRQVDQVGLADGERNFIANLVNDLASSGLYGPKYCGTVVSYPLPESGLANVTREEQAYDAVRESLSLSIAFMSAILYGGRAEEGLGSDVRLLYDHILSKFPARSGSLTNLKWFSLVNNVINDNNPQSSLELAYANCFYDRIVDLILRVGEPIYTIPRPSLAVKADDEIKFDALKTFKGLAIGTGVVITTVVAIKWVKFARSKAIEMTAKYNEILYNGNAQASDIRSAYKRAKLWNNLSFGAAGKITGADFSASSLTNIPIYEAITGSKLS